MKRWFPVAAIVAVLAAAPATAPAAALTVDDIIAMAEAGVSEEVILDTIQKSGQKFELSAADLKRLRKAKVSEKVIRALQGKPEPAAAGGPREQAEEARRRERERIEAEERRRAEEAERERRVRSGQAEELAAEGELTRPGRSDVDRLIDQAYDVLDDGGHEAAAIAFDKVVAGGLAAPNTANFVDASYGLAEALTRLGLPSAALPHVVEVLRHGPKAPRFDEALRLLGRQAARVDTMHPILELMDGFDVSGRPPEVRDAHAFLVGSYLARSGEHDRARARLTKVRADSAFAPAAAYRLGLVEFAAGRPLEGLHAFERAVQLADARGDGEVRDLSYLALARIAYEVGRFDAAIDYYKRIPPGSASRARARYELIWALVLAGDDAGALAAIAVLESERYADFMWVDRGVLEATIYLDLCRYELARARAGAFLAEAAPLLGWLEKVVDLEAPAAYAEALRQPVGRLALLSDVDTHVAASAAAAVAGEEKRLAELAGDLGPLAKRIAPGLAERRKALHAQAAAAALRRLRALRLEVADLVVNAEEVKIEVDLAQRELLYREISLSQTQGALRKPRLADDEAWWEVDEERWVDEEDDVRSLMTSVCPSEEDVR